MGQGVPQARSSQAHWLYIFWGHCVCVPGGLGPGGEGSGVCASSLSAPGPEQHCVSERGLSKEPSGPFVSPGQSAPRKLLDLRGAQAWPQGPWLLCGRSAAFPALGQPWGNGQGQARGLGLRTWDQRLGGGVGIWAA